MSASGAGSLAGRVLDGRYELLRLLGQGGMGVVYLATQKTVGRQVAVKLLSMDRVGDEESVRRFENEARVVAGLWHPNTLTLFDFGRTAEGQLYLVTELLHGEALSDVLERSPLSERDTLDVLRQVLGALNEAHAAGIFHRDLKPANLYVERVAGAPFYRVLDFGLAKASDMETLTVSGQIVGTPPYMSPEQAEGLVVTGATDLYSLGIVAYECLTGRVPFEGSTPYAVLLKHIQTPVPPISDAVAGLSEETRALVHALLEKAPGDRPGSAAEALARVERALSALPPSGTAPAVVRKPLSMQPPTMTFDGLAAVSPQGPPRWLKRAAWAAVIVSALLIGARLVRDHSQPEPAVVSPIHAPVVAAVAPSEGVPQSAPEAAPVSATFSATVSATAMAPPEPAPLRPSARPSSAASMRPSAAPAPAPTVTSVTVALSPRRASHRLTDRPEIRAIAANAQGASVSATKLSFKVSPQDRARVEGGHLVLLSEGRGVLSACTPDGVCGEVSFLALDEGDVP